MQDLRDGVAAYRRLDGVLDVRHVDLAPRGLPPVHRDPFDRLLVAQAIVEPLRLVSGNVQRPLYSELIVRV